jgi:DNA repair exonuclease SbcCD ATPase subunit
LNYRDLPAFVLAKLFDLDQQAEALAAKATEIQSAIEETRDRLNGRIRRAGDDPRALRGEFERLLSEQAALKSRLHAEMATLSRCKAFLDLLPADAKLEPATVSAEGKELAATRDRIKALSTEIDALKRAPAPSSDIEARVREYIAQLAPSVRGVGIGERLSIVWPGAQQSSEYYQSHSCDPLALIALCFSDRLVAAAMREVERMANDPLPVAERAPRIAALERELDELHRVEEALVTAAIAAGQAVHRLPSAPPAAVLGVRIDSKVSRAA